MRTDAEELEIKRETITGLSRQLAIKDKRIAELTKLLNEATARAIAAEQQLKPVKDSLNKMTSERSKWMKKLRRAGIAEI